MQKFMSFQESHEHRLCWGIGKYTTKHNAGRQHASLNIIPACLHLDPPPISLSLALEQQMYNYIVHDSYARIIPICLLPNLFMRSSLN